MISLLLSIPGALPLAITFHVFSVKPQRVWRSEIRNSQFAIRNSVPAFCLLLTAHCLLFSSSLLFISDIIRFTSGGKARPFLSFSAGTVCTPGIPGDAAIRPPVVGPGAAGAFLLTAVAGFSPAGGACFAAGLTARAISSSYPQRSHCQRGK